MGSGFTAQSQDWGIALTRRIYTPAALACMTTCAVVPYLVFAFRQCFFTSARYTDDCRQNY